MTIRSDWKECRDLSAIMQNCGSLATVALMMLLGYMERLPRHRHGLEMAPSNLMFDEMPF